MVHSSVADPVSAPKARVYKQALDRQWAAAERRAGSLESRMRTVGQGRRSEVLDRPDKYPSSSLMIEVDCAPLIRHARRKLLSIGQFRVVSRVVLEAMLLGYVVFQKTVFKTNILLR